MAGGQWYIDGKERVFVPDGDDLPAEWAPPVQGGEKRSNAAARSVVIGAPGGGATPEAEGAPSADGVPDGNISDVRAWVGDDLARAQTALDAELMKGDQARSSLVDALVNQLGVE